MSGAPCNGELTFIMKAKSYSIRIILEYYNECVFGGDGGGGGGGGGAEEILLQEE